MCVPHNKIKHIITWFSSLNRLTAPKFEASEPFTLFPLTRKTHFKLIHSLFTNSSTSIPYDFGIRKNRTCIKKYEIYTLSFTVQKHV